MTSYTSSICRAVGVTAASLLEEEHTIPHSRAIPFFLKKKENPSEGGLSVQVEELNQDHQHSPLSIFYVLTLFLTDLNGNCGVSSPSRYSILISVTL